VAVTREGEAVVEVGLGLLVLDVSGLDLGVEEREASSDALLLFTEQVERDRSGVMGLELLPLVSSSRSAVPLPFVRLWRVQAVELTGDEFRSAVTMCGAIWMLR
jgi:hypothetical protein